MKAPKGITTCIGAITLSTLTLFLFSGCVASSGTGSTFEDTSAIDSNIAQDIEGDAVAVDGLSGDQTSDDAAVPSDAVTDDAMSPVDAGIDVSVDDATPSDSGATDTSVTLDVSEDDIASEDTADADKPKSPIQKLCESTGGTWDEASCGHWKCGEPPACDAIIPGCNCGEGKVFDGGVGCMESPECKGGFGAEDLCEVSGGDWLDDTCGHWECGIEPLCEAIIPGCNCGEGLIFDEQAGCIMWPECEEQWLDNKEALCTDTGGKWVPNSCGDWTCGDAPMCLAIIPGCNCGDGMNFHPVKGCFEDPKCDEPGDPGGKEELCSETGGKWLPDTCGDWTCGEPPLCKAIVPGCNCGKGMNFHPEKGCFKDPKCDAIGLPDDEKELCVDSGGKWLTETCGHWKCGIEPLCEAIIPGCNCGKSMTFDAVLGCIPNPNCGPVAGNDPFTLCITSGGKWDPMACNSWECGVAPKPCDKPQGGCDCGKGKLLVKEYGCLESLYCDGADDGTLCTETGGKYLKETCGNFYCGVEPQNCGVTKPGCDCGKDSLFFPKYGCNVSTQCN